MDKEKILLTIAARGGSKGVKNKNIRNLCGKPLIAHTILQAKKWGKARRIVCSTDSPEIARIAKDYGVEVPFIRPKKLARDNTPKLLCVKHALKESERIFKEKYDIIVDLDATALIRKIKDLNGCLSLFKKVKPKTLFTVVRAHKNPYFNMVEKKKNGFVKLCKKLKASVVRRQEAPHVFSMNASIYLYSRDFLYSDNIMPFSDRTAIYVMDEISSYDIDREIDFKFIEFLINEGIWKSEI